MTIRILIADDHEVVRIGLKSLFSGTEIEVVGEASNGDEVVRLVLHTRPDLLLMDMRMPEGDGLTTLQRLKNEAPQLPILMFSTFRIPTYITQAYSLGAVGYILKGSERQRIVEMIQKAASGQATWDREELRRVHAAVTTMPAEVDLETPLTQRESEVLLQLATGQTNKEIAQALHISYETVKEHVQHVLQKIGVADRTQAAVWAVKEGIV